jgi:hypothetical protein
MKEILGAELDLAFKELNINALKTYEIKNFPWEYSEVYQVWELSEEDFKRICEIPNNEWKDDWGWWRFVEGSNLGGVDSRYNINNHYIYAWDGVSRINFEEENKNCKPEDRWFRDRKYKTLLNYFCEEIGASTERNVCAVAVDIAKQNGIKMSELFIKYQG